MAIMLITPDDEVITGRELTWGMSSKNSAITPDSQYYEWPS